MHSIDSLTQASFTIKNQDGPRQVEMTRSLAAQHTCIVIEHLLFCFFFLVGWRRPKGAETNWLSHSFCVLLQDGFTSVVVLMTATLARGHNEWTCMCVFLVASKKQSLVISDRPHNRNFACWNGMWIKKMSASHYYCPQQQMLLDLSTNNRRNPSCAIALTHS